REMHAVVTVEARSSGGGGGPGRAPAAEVIIIDTSGSMSYRGKMAAAKRAARAAVNVLRDGVRFAVVAGANRPRMVYPQGERLAAGALGAARAATRAARRPWASRGAGARDGGGRGAGRGAGGAAGGAGGRGAGVPSAEGGRASSCEYTAESVRDLGAGHVCP